MDTVVMDLERVSLDELASVVVVVVADAADAAAVRPFLLMSSMGVEVIADGRVPAGADETRVEYLRAKWAALGTVVEVVSGTTPIEEAVAALG